MELGLVAQRLSALATCRAEAVIVLGALVTDMQDRMRLCRAAGTRSIWDLTEKERPVPVVVIVDELAELYLTNGSSRGTRAPPAVRDPHRTLLRLRAPRHGRRLTMPPPP